MPPTCALWMEAKAPGKVRKLLMEDSTTFHWHSAQTFLSVPPQAVRDDADGKTYSGVGPTSLLSIINIVHSVIFFLLFWWRTLPNTVQPLPSTTEWNYLRKQHKKKCRDQNVPGERCQPLTSWSLQALGVAHACLSDRCCLCCFPWKKKKIHIGSSGMRLSYTPPLR